MNAQTRLSELDRAKLANLQLRQQLLNEQTERFHADVFAAYGNPGECLGLGVNGELTRTPEEPPLPPSAVAKEKRKKVAQ